MILKKHILTQLFIAAFILAVTTGSAQQSDPYLNFGGGLLSYNGDMGSFDESGMGLTMGIRFTKKKLLNGSFNLGFGSVSDDDPTILPAMQVGDVRPNTYFKSSLAYFNYTLNINILKNEKWWIYAAQGIGFLRFSPKNENGENLVDFDNTREAGEDYRTSTFMLPTSVGAVYHLSDEWGVGISAVLLNIQTDYLDNISNLGNSGNDNVLSISFNLNKKITLSKTER